jgi:uncharacterized membrane protein
MPNQIRVAIALPLTDIARNLSAGQMSSTDYADMADSGLSPLDLLYTFTARYDKLIEADLPFLDGEGPEGDGSYIQYSVSHPMFAVLTTFAFASVSLANVYNTYLHKRRAKNNCSYHYMYKQFDSSAARTVRKRSSADNDKIYDINYYLNLMLLEDAELQKKYQSMRVNHETGTLDLVPAEIKPAVATFTSTKDKIINKVFYPAWISLNIASFVYWILWIGGALFTGFPPGVVGVAALPEWLGFGLPVLAGLAYPFIKVVNYFRNKNKKALMPAAPVHHEQMAEMTEDSCSLFRRALLRKKFDLRKAELTEQLRAHNVEMEIHPRHKAACTASKMDKEIVSLSKNKFRKTAITLLSVIGGTFVAAQYGAWIVMDIVGVMVNLSSALPLINFVLGSILLVGTGLYGLVKAYEKFQSVKKFQNDEVIQELKKETDDEENLEHTLAVLEKIVRSKQKKLGEPVVGLTHLIKHDDDQFFADSSRQGPSKTTQLKKAGRRLYHFINGFCTGAFLGRLFLVKGTAIVLPFTALSMSLPVCIAVLVAIGIVYGAFKTYEYHQKRKEQKAEELLKRRVERIECLHEQIELARMENRLYSIKLIEKDELEDSPAPEPYAGKGLFKANPILRSKAIEDFKDEAVAVRDFLPQAAV